MKSAERVRDEGNIPSPESDADVSRWVAWFHELDAWTEYWDIYHPETRGRFYFGDDHGESGLLTAFMPGASHPAPYVTWTRLALAPDRDTKLAFAKAIGDPQVASAILEVDALVSDVFARHFGDPSDPVVQTDYLSAMFRFAIDSLPSAGERDGKIAVRDPRKPTAGRHTLRGDLMWFAWALHTEAADRLTDGDRGHARRALFLAGVALGCSADFAWKGHRRTRAEYRPEAKTAALLHERGMRWAAEFDLAREEIYSLYRIRELGYENSRSGDSTPTLPQTTERGSRSAYSRKPI